MKRINIVSAVMVLLAVFSSVKLHAQGFGHHEPETHKEPGTSVPRPGQQEILLGVYKLDKALLADLLEDNALQIFIQLYLLRSSAFEAGKSLSTLPDEEKMLLAQNCMLIKGNLLLVMATAQQQEQIAEFLKKLEAACEKTIAAKQDVEIETVVVKTPEGKRMEYGVPGGKAIHHAQQVIVQFLAELLKGNDQAAFALFTPKAQEEYRKSGMTLDSNMFQGMSFRFLGYGTSPGLDDYVIVGVDMMKDSEHFNTTWIMRKIGDEYRIAGMTMMFDDDKAITLDFENPAKTLHSDSGKVSSHSIPFHPVAEPYFGPAHVQTGTSSQAHPYTVPREK